MQFFLFILLIFFSLLSNLPLKNIIGTLGGSLIFLIAPSTLLLSSYIQNFNIKIPKLVNYFGSYYFITLTVSLVILLYQIVFKGNYTSIYGDDLLFKLIFSSTYNLVFFIYTFSICILLEKISNNDIFLIILLAFYCMVIVSILQYFTIYDFSIFHSDIIEYKRIRLLFPEPSIAAFSVNILGILIIFYYPRLSSRVINSSILLILNLIIASKASIVLILFASFLSFIFLKKSLKTIFIYIFVVILVSPFLILYIYTVLMTQFKTDIEFFTSTATRLATTIWGISSLYHFPFGEGYGTYIIYFKPPLINAISFIEEHIGHMNFSELYKMINTGKYVSVKSGLLSQIVYSGALALIFYWSIFKEAIKQCKYKLKGVELKIYLTLIFYIILSITISVNTELAYLYVLPLTLICVKRF